MSMWEAHFLLRVGRNILTSLCIVAALLIVAAIFFFFVEISLILLAQVPIYFEIFWAILIVFFSLIFIEGTLKSALPKKFSGWVSRLLVVGLVAVDVLGFAGAVAALAVALAYYRPAEYADVGSLTSGDLAHHLYEHFLWRFVDLIPGLEVWKVIAVKDPVSEAGIYAGALLIAYKAVIIAMFFETFRRLLFPVEEGKGTATHDIVSDP